MRPSIAFSLLALVLPSLARAGGDGTRGGGNAILCDDGKTYAWDYINHQEGQMPIDPALLKLRSASAILKAISKKLAHANVPMYRAMEDFRQLNGDILSKNSRYTWLSGKNPLAPLGDQTRLRIPESCVANADKGFKLSQAVVREGPDPGVAGRVLFNSDPRVLDALKKNSPVQLSYLYVHEWLRDYTDDTDILPIAVQLLHSSDLPTAGELYDALTSFGLKVPYPGLVDGSYAVPETRGGEEPGSVLGELRIQRTSDKTTLSFPAMPSLTTDASVPGGPWRINALGASSADIAITAEEGDVFRGTATFAVRAQSGAGTANGTMSVHFEKTVMDTEIVCVQPTFSAKIGDTEFPLASQSYFCLDTSQDDSL